MIKEEKARRMNDRELFGKCMVAFPKEMGMLRREFEKASRNRDNAKILRLTDRYCRLTLKVEPRCEFR